MMNAECKMKNLGGCGFVVIQFDSGWLVPGRVASGGEWENFTVSLPVIGGRKEILALESVIYR
jgi:hypothetical protein